MNSFETHRPLLWSIAYRMLGSAAEAEDIVQEAYLRAHDADPDSIQSERAYLSKIVTRLCLDHWKSARVKREAYVGPWLPEPVPTAEPVDPSSISLAFLVLLESLTPLERAVYLLGEVFDYSHAEIAQIVGRDEASCRQLLHRARTSVRSQRPRFAPSREAHQRLLSGFGEACAAGDLAMLEQLLADDVVAYSDGGEKLHAAKRPVHGRDRVARLFTGIFRKAPPGVTIAMTELNGLPTLVLVFEGKVRSVIDIETDGTRILKVRTVVNPEKLSQLGSPPRLDPAAS